MTEKWIIKNGEVVDTDNNITFDSFTELLTVLNGQSRHLTRLSEENEQLKHELFEAKEDYLLASSDEVDRILYVPDEIEELRINIFEKGIYDD